MNRGLKLGISLVLLLLVNFLIANAGEYVPDANTVAL